MAVGRPPLATGPRQAHESGSWAGFVPRVHESGSLARPSAQLADPGSAARVMVRAHATGPSAGLARPTITSARRPGSRVERDDRVRRPGHGPDRQPGSSTGSTTGLIGRAHATGPSAGLARPTIASIRRLDPQVERDAPGPPPGSWPGHGPGGAVAVGRPSLATWPRQDHGPGPCHGSMSRDRSPNHHLNSTTWLAGRTRRSGVRRPGHGPGPWSGSMPRFHEPGSLARPSPRLDDRARGSKATIRVRRPVHGSDRQPGPSAAARPRSRAEPQSPALRPVAPARSGPPGARPRIKRPNDCRPFYIYMIYIFVLIYGSLFVNRAFEGAASVERVFWSDSWLP